jgi:hypothetical protein
VLAAELVLPPSGGAQTARAAMAATTSVPIVFGIGEDPVKEGLVPNLNRPGANATGVTFFTALLGAKRLGIVPGTELIALLVNQNSSATAANTGKGKGRSKMCRKRHAASDNDLSF